MTKNIMDIKDTKKTKKRRTNLLWYIFIALGIAGILDTIVLIPFMPGIDAGLIMPALFGSVLILYSLLRLKKKGPIIGKESWTTAPRPLIHRKVLLWEPARLFPSPS